jgi:hypothetical protein
MTNHAARTRSLPALGLVVAASILLGAPETPSAAGHKVELRNLRVNLTGALLVDVVLTTPPAITTRVPVKIEYEGVSETLQVANVAAVNVPRTATATQPFPCNATHTVRATVLDLPNLPLGGHSIEASLSRRCTASQGTPDLIVESIERVPTRARPEEWFAVSPETPVRLKVVVKNASAYAMAFNEQGGTPWQVQVTPGGAQMQRLALPLQPQQSYPLEFTIAVACRQLTDVTAWVDTANVIKESNETNNRLTAKIPGNNCGI